MDVRVESDDPDRFTPSAAFRTDRGAFPFLVLAEARPGPKGLIARFAGITTIEAASELVGRRPAHRSGPAAPAGTRPVLAGPADRVGGACRFRAGGGGGGRDPGHAGSIGGVSSGRRRRRGPVRNGPGPRGRSGRRAGCGSNRPTACWTSGEQSGIRVLNGSSAPRTVIWPSPTSTVTGIPHLCSSMPAGCGTKGGGG